MLDIYLHYYIYYINQTYHHGLDRFWPISHKSHGIMSLNISFKSNFQWNLSYIFEKLPRPVKCSQTTTSVF